MLSLRLAGRTVAVLGGLVLGCASDGPAGGGPGAIARVGDYEIDAEHVRSAALKLLQTEDVGTLSADQRQQVMAVLVGSRLLAIEAERRDLQTAGPIRQGLATALREAVNELYMQRHVEAAIEITEAEVRSQFEAWGSGEEIEAAHILLPSREQAESVMAELAAGAEFADLAREHSRHVGSASRGGSMGYLRKFLIPDPLRPVLWGRPVGYVHAEPVHTGMGYHIVAVLDRRHRSLPQQEQAIRGFLTRKRRAALKRELNRRLQEEYAFEWRRQTAAAAIRQGPTAPGDSVLARWRSGVLTVDDFRRRARGPDASATDPDRVRVLVEELALEDLVLAAGRAEGLDREPEVARKIGKARLRLLGEALFASLGTADDAAARRFYGSHRESYRGPTRVTVQEILLPDRATADSLHALIAAGADMADLARRHSLREASREAGGVWTDVDRDAPGSATLYRKAMAGDGLLEPIAVPTGGVSILRVLEKAPGPVHPYEEVAEAVRNDLQLVAMEDLIARLRVRHEDEIHVDAEALRGIR